jgi:hypothetical protein
MFKVAITVAFFLAVAAAALNTSPVGIPITTAVTQFAKLTPGQVTGPIPSTSAVGAAIFNYNSVSGILMWEIIHTVDTPTAAHIHGPAFIGSDGSPIVFFTSPVSPIVGNATFSAANAAYLTAGQLYVNIHSSAFPNGEIRGQIMNNGQQVVDFISQTNSVAHAMVYFNAAASTLSYNVSHNAVNATAMHIHGPADEQNTNNPVLFLANNSAQAVGPVIGTQAISVAESNWFSSELNYINIHTEAYGAGELRGQILAPRVMYALPLDGQQAGVNSTNLGIALVSVSNNGSTIDVFVVVTISYSDTYGVHVHAPASYGNTASPVVILAEDNVSDNPYATCNSTITGWMAQGLAYVNVHSYNFGNGELRGQFTPLGSGYSGSTSTSSTSATSATSVTSSTSTGSAVTTGHHSSASVVGASAVIAAIFSAVALF